MNQYTLASNFSVPGTVNDDVNDDDSDDDDVPDSKKLQLYDNSNQFGQSLHIDEEDEDDNEKDARVNGVAQSDGYITVDESVF